jgi:hypothetical protein
VVSYHVGNPGLERRRPRRLLRGRDRRAVAARERLEGEELTNVYFREGVERRYSGEKLAEITDAFLAIGREFDGLYTHQTPLGQKEAIVVSFRNAHVFLFPVSGETTVFLSVDREVGSNLSTFVERCSNELYTL